LDELTCTAKCEYATRDNDVGEQEESEWSTEVLKICRLVFGKVYPESQFLGMGPTRKVTLLQVRILRLYSSDVVEILLVKILAVDMRPHRAGSTLNDRKNTLNLFEDEPGKQRFLERKEQKDQDTCINNCNAVLSPSSIAC
jgi:hypothetical protein